jgi:hypothetical protein
MPSPSLFKVFIEEIEGVQKWLDGCSAVPIATKNSRTVKSTQDINQGSLILSLGLEINQNYQMLESACNAPTVRRFRSINGINSLTGRPSA